MALAHDNPAAPGEHQLFLQHRELIEKTIRAVCREKNLPKEEAEDFAQSVRLKLLEDDGAVLRKYRGQSSLATYLRTVVLRHLLDLRNSHWGKWHPSAEAVRLGPSAERLERLLVRDRVGFEAAVQTLVGEDPLARPEIEKLAEKLPPRTPRQRVGDELLLNLPGPGVDQEEALRQGEAAQAGRAALRALNRSFADLDPEDRLILRLRYREGRKIRDIARMLALPERSLYVRVERLKTQLRKRLEAQGITSTGEDGIS